MVAYMKENLLSPEEAEKVDLQSWIYEPGIPANAPAITSNAFTEVEKQADVRKSGTGSGQARDTRMVDARVAAFPADSPDTIPAERLDDLDKTFKLSTSGNSEIQFAVQGRNRQSL